jgi:hypothetical protein
MSYFEPFSGIYSSIFTMFSQESNSLANSTQVTQFAFSHILGYFLAVSSGCGHSQYFTFLLVLQKKIK